MNFLRQRAVKGDIKNHYRMFKAGKVWIFTSMALFALISGGQLRAQADVTSPVITAKMGATDQSQETTPAKLRTATSEAIHSESSATVKAQSAEAVPASDTAATTTRTAAAPGSTAEQLSKVAASSAANEVKPVQSAVSSTTDKSKTAAAMASSAANEAQPSQPAVSSAATEPKPVVKVPVTPNKEAEKTAHAMAVQANQYAQTASSYATIVKNTTTQAAVSHAQSAYHQAQVTANLAQHFDSLANMYGQLTADDPSTNLADSQAAALQSAKAAVDMTNQYLIQALSAADEAKLAATVGMVGLANQHYQTATTAAKTAEDNVKKATDAAKHAYLAVQYDHDNQNVLANYNLASNAVITAKHAADLAQTEASLAMKGYLATSDAASTNDYLATSQALDQVQQALSQAQQSATEAMQAESTATSTADLANQLAIQDLRSVATQQAHQATADEQTAQQAASEAAAQHFQGHQAAEDTANAKKAATVVTEAATAAKSAANALMQASTAEEAAQLAQLVTTNAKAATSEAQVAVEALALAKKFSTNVANEQTVDNGGTLMLDADGAVVSVGTKVNFTTQLSDLGHDSLGSTFTVYKKPNYT